MHTPTRSPRPSTSSSLLGAPILVAAFGASVFAVACGASEPGDPSRMKGPSTFEAPVDGLNRLGVPGRNGVDDNVGPGGPLSGGKSSGAGAGGAAVPGNAIGMRSEVPPPSPAPGGGSPRLIEEGDIVKTSGSTLFVLNRYRGFQVVDATTPEKLTLASRVPLAGRPVEMYLRGRTIFALIADYPSQVACAECPGGSALTMGSRLVAIDVTDLRASRLIGSLDLAGSVTDSRLVGDAIYVVAQQAPGYGRVLTKGSGFTNATVVTSIDISTPAVPKQVGRLELPRGGWNDHVHITDKQLFLASSGYGSVVDGKCVPPAPPVQVAPGPTGGASGAGGVAGSGGAPVSGAAATPGVAVMRAAYAPCTRLQSIDVAAPNGAIKSGAFIDVPGSVADRWSFDWFDGTLRVVLSNVRVSTSTGLTPPVIRTFKSPNPNELSALGQTAIQLPRPETVTATRFDGPRAFVVTFERVDPLWTIDLSKPEQPRAVGHLEIPGFVDHLEPRGNLLVALGHDSPSGRPPFAMHVSLFDVSDLAQPKQLVRQQFGEGQATIPGRRDDWGKVFRVLDDRKLVLAPYRTYSTLPTSPEEAKERAFVQLLDLDLDKATIGKRGSVEHDGAIERAVLLGDLVLAVSNQQVQAIDVRDRDKPRITGTLELARSVDDVSVAGDRLLAVTGGERGGAQSLLLLAASDPDAAPLARLEVQGRVGRILVNGGFAYVFSQSDAAGPASKPGFAFSGPSSDTVGNVFEGWQVTVYDLGEKPRARGSLRVPFFPNLNEEQADGLGAGVTQVNGSTLVLAYERDFECGRTEDGDPGLERPGSSSGGSTGSAGGMGSSGSSGAGGSTGSGAAGGSASSDSTGAAGSTGGVTMTSPALVLDGQAPGLTTKCDGPADDFLILDLANPDQPKLASRVRLEGAASVAAAGTQGTTFFVDHYEEIPGVDRNNRVIVKGRRMFVTRVDLTSPARPVLSGKINVPGAFVRARASDDTIFTIEPKVDQKTDTSSLVLMALYQPRGSTRAYLEGRLTLEGASGMPIFGERAAYLTIDGELVAIDLADPRNLRVASRVPVPGASRGQGAAGARGDVPEVRGGSGVAVDAPGFGPGFGPGLYDLEGLAEAHLLAGNTLFVRLDAAAGVRWQLFDVAMPTRPALGISATLPNGNGGLRVSPSGHRAFQAAGPYGIESFSLAAPAM